MQRTNQQASHYIYWPDFCVCPHFCIILLGFLVFLTVLSCKYLELALGHSFLQLFKCEVMLLDVLLCMSCCYVIVRLTWNCFFLIPMERPHDISAWIVTVHSPQSRTSSEQLSTKQNPILTRKDVISWHRPKNGWWHNITPPHGASQREQAMEPKRKVYILREPNPRLAPRGVNVLPLNYSGFWELSLLS